MPQRIIYKSEQDITNFNIDRFVKSLNKYGAIDKPTVEKAIDEFGNFDPMHVSCLVEIGARLLPEEAAKRYFNDHKEWFNEADFERLRRITGYLVGTLSRWNDAKKAEEHARVKHSIGDYDHSAGQYSPEEKTAIEVLKMENSVMSQF